MEVTLTTEERELLLEILEERHRELLREISRAAHNEFKLGLKKNEKVLQSTINKLRALSPEQLAAIPA